MMSDDLTDAHYDWVELFCGLDVRPAPDDPPPVRADRDPPRDRNAAAAPAAEPPTSAAPAPAAPAAGPPAPTPLAAGPPTPAAPAPAASAAGPSIPATPAAGPPASAAPAVGPPAARQPVAGPPSAAAPASPSGKASAANTPVKTSGGAGKKDNQFADHQANPFDAPEVLVEIEKLALPKVQDLAVQQAQNAARDFETAITKVKSTKKAAAAEEEAHRELMMTIAISIALLPAGPLIEAAAAGLAGPALRNQLGDLIANNAPMLEKKFGASGVKATDKVFNFVASEQVGKLAEAFDAAKAKAALEWGKDKLKDKAIKFAASSDQSKAVESFLDALLKSANDSMHNLTDLIQTTQDISSAVAYYNLFSMPLQGSYEAALTQQVDDMLSELNAVIAEHGEALPMPSAGASVQMGLDEIVSIPWGGRKMLAHVRKLTSATVVSTFDLYVFRKWVTPDMLEAATRLIKEDLKIEDFKGQHIPEPTLEPGERIVWVPDNGKDRLMLISVEDQHGWFSIDYGVCTFKEWAETQDDIRAFTSRGALQNGGINKMGRKDIKGIPAH